MALVLREMSDEERATVERWAHSRTEPVRRVERARMVWYASQGQKASAIGRRLEISRYTVRRWLKRFNATGLAALEDEPRSGRPPTYSREEVGAALLAALTKPSDLGLPFGSWTLDRLVAYLQEKKGITMKRSRLQEVLVAEGLRWRSQETWFGERVDPEFAEKRGPSSGSTHRRQRAAS